LDQGVGQRIPKNTIRSWHRGHVSDIATAIETAIANGWIEPSQDSATFTALNVLVAWIQAYGSLRSGSYVPIFRIGDEAQREILTAAIEQLGAPFTVERVDQSRTTEIRITEDASLLGRVLACLGAPVGRKTESDYVIPAYVYGDSSQASQYIAVWLIQYGVTDGDEVRFDSPSRFPDSFVQTLESLGASVVGVEYQPDGSMSFESEHVEELFSECPPGV
jgi:hypothetical protein